MNCTWNIPASTPKSWIDLIYIPPCFFLEIYFLNIEFPAIFPWHSHKIPIKLWWKPGVWGIIEHQGTVGFPSPAPGSFDHRRRFAMLWCSFVPMFAEFLMTGDGESRRLNGLDKLRKTPQGSTWLGAMSSHVEPCRAMSSHVEPCRAMSSHVEPCRNTTWNAGGRAMRKIDPPAAMGLSLGTSLRAHWEPINTEWRGSRRLDARSEDPESFFVWLWSKRFSMTGDNNMYFSERWV